VPFGEGDAFLVGWDGSEDFKEAVDPVWWQFNSLADCVDEPAEDDLPGRPTTITFQ
jgi:hypothetical protein